MGLFDSNEKSRQPTDSQLSNHSTEVYQPAKTAVLTKHSKEDITVQRVTLQDMEQFSLLPFVWNSDIQKVIGPSIQPYAYIDIVGSNIYAACLELEEMNKLLLEANRCTPLVPRITDIPVDDIVFTPSKKTSYSKIICSPYSFSGRVSKYPASLFFTTSHMVDEDSTHGELFYGRSGKVEKAEVICWRKKNGFFFYFKTIDGKLALDKIVSTIIINDRGLPGTIYKSHHK